MAAGKARILFFQAWPTRANVCGERYLFDPAQQDAEVEITRVDDGSSVTTTAVGGAETNIVIDSLSLTPGDVYRARLRYQDTNSAWGPWSDNAFSTVPVEFEPAAISTPGEPGSGGTLPIVPDQPITLRRDRPMVERRTETGHRWRRPRNTVGGRLVRFTFGPMSTADKDTLVAFLEARIAAAEGFLTGIAELGDQAYFARAGSYTITFLAPGTWRVELDAEEVRG